MSCCFFGSITSLKPRAKTPAGEAARTCASLGNQGFTLIQVMIATGLILVSGIGGVHSLLTVNREAADMRMLSNARAILQRNIDTALGVPFDASTTPAILATTSSSGSVYDDDGGGDNVVNVSSLRSGNTLLTGTLTRTVVAEANSDNADIRRVTFQLNYSFRGRPFSYQMTTLRTQD